MDGDLAPARAAPVLSLAALIETVVLLAGLIALDLFFGSGDRFLAWPIHPFAAVVLLIAAQYGAAEALVAATIAAIALYAFNLPAQSIDEDIIAYGARLAAPPALWAGAGLVVGLIVDGHIGRASQLSREREMLAHSMGDAHQRIEELSRHRDDLEARIAGQLQSFATLYRTARQVEAMSVGEVLIGAAAAIRSVLGADAFSIYLANGDALESALSEGWHAHDDFLRVLRRGEPLFEAIATERRVLSVTDPAEERLLAGQGLIAAPIASPRSGRVFGMIKLERLKLAALTVATRANAAALGDWLALAIERAEAHTEADQSRLLNRQRTLVSHHVFTRMLGFVRGLGQRMGFPVTIVYLRVRGASLSPGEVADAIGLAAAETLRETDLACESPEPGWDTAILLAGADPEIAAAVRDKLIRAVAARLGRAGDEARIEARIAGTGGEARAA